MRVSVAQVRTQSCYRLVNQFAAELGVEFQNWEVPPGDTALAPAHLWVPVLILSPGRCPVSTYFVPVTPSVCIFKGGPAAVFTFLLLKWPPPALYQSVTAA